MKRLIAIGLICLCLGCTANQRAKQLGGTTTENLPQGKKLVMATWKADSLWVLTRPMREGEEAERYEFKEYSSYGILQGTVVFQEVK